MSDAKDDIFPTARRPTERSEGEVAPRPEPPAAPAAPEPPPRPPASAAETVVLEFGSFREFIDDYSPHISPQGMYLVDSRHPPGTPIVFEVRLSDDFRLIHGRGEIEWTVAEATRERPAGAAMRFTDLDPPSRRLVGRLVDNHRGSGGAPFDIDSPPPVSPGPSAPEPRPLIDPSLAAGLGTETLALPISLQGQRDETPPAAGPQLGAPAAGRETQEPDLAFDADEVADTPREDDPAGPEDAPVAAEEAVVETPRPMTPESPPQPAAELRESSLGEEAKGPTPPPPALDDAFDAGFDAGKTQIVQLPDDLRQLASAEEAVVETEQAAPEPVPVPLIDDAGFEAAEWQLPTAPEGTGPGEEALPVMPLTGDDPLAGIEPAESPLFDLEDLEDLEDKAKAAEPEVVEDLSFEREAPRPAPVEMPDEEDVAGDYYRASGPPRRGRTGLWVGLCLLAVLLGAAAWRFQDQWIGYLPAAVTGGGAQPASRDAASPVADDPPAMADAPSADPLATDLTAAAEGGANDESAGAAREDGTEIGGDTAAPEPSADERAAAPVEDGEAADVAAGAKDEDEGEAAVSPEPVVVAAEPPAAAPGGAVTAPTEVTGLSFRRVGEVTEVLIATDAGLSTDSFSVVRVAEPPARQVIKIFGPERPFGREAVAVGSEHVRRLRTGFHRVGGRGEVHVVADLTGPGVRVLGTEIRGSTLVVRFGAR